METILQTELSNTRVLLRGILILVEHRVIRSPVVALFGVVR